MIKCQPSSWRKSEPRRDMPMKRFAMLMIGLALVATAWSEARAEPMGGPPMGGPPMMPPGHMGRGMMGEGPGFMLPLLLRQASLTPDQNTKVRQIMDADHETLRTLFHQLQAANDELANKLFAPGTVQASDLTPQVQHVMQLRQQLMEQGLKTALALRAILTPEQLAKVTQVRAQLEKLQGEMRTLLGGAD